MQVTPGNIQLLTGCRTGKAVLQGNLPLHGIITNEQTLPGLNHHAAMLQQQADHA